MPGRSPIASLAASRITSYNVCYTKLLRLLPGESDKQSKLKLDVLLSQGSIGNDEPRFCVEDRNPSFDKGELAEQMVKDALPGILTKTPQKLEYTVRNVNRVITSYSIHYTKLYDLNCKPHDSHVLEEKPTGHRVSNST